MTAHELPASDGTATAHRSLRLEIAVAWLLATQPVMGLVLLFALPLSAQEGFVGCVVAALIAWVLYEVWYSRRWAKYPLIVLLIVALIITASKVPNFPDLDSIGRFAIGLLWAGADGVAYDELKKVVKINPPVI